MVDFPIYKQIHKIELIEIRVDEQTISDRKNPYNVAEIQELIKQGVTSIWYHRKLYPTDYLRKEEMCDNVVHWLQENRVEFIPDLVEDDPQQLPYYYIRCKRVTIQFLETEGQKILIFKAIKPEGLDEDKDKKLTQIATFYLKTVEKWCRTYDEGGYTKRVHHDKVVPRDAFTVTYRRMKEKYHHWVEDWKESTDPQKFVFEDISIAAFLITLWQIEHGDKKPSFVDLGAGNGFLVYLLAMEGYEGYGIDIAKRKIWDRYPDCVKLVEAPIKPDEENFDVDWLIGNHSDELTPWIPLIASRSNKNFFLLPCCEWDFDRRFTGRTPKMSRYNFYLEFIKTITSKMGYLPEVEHLRIPSTRNIAIVGRKRTVDPITNSSQLEEARSELLKNSSFTCFEPRFRSQASHCSSSNNKKKRQRK